MKWGCQKNPVSSLQSVFGVSLEVFFDFARILIISRFDTFQFQPYSSKSQKYGQMISDEVVKSRYFSNLSFLRKSRAPRDYFNGFWTPAGVYPVLDAGPE